MDHLTEEYWETFRSGDGNKGKKFEKLVSFLLRLNIFPGEWSSTGDGSDGARDFENFGSDIAAWAECKIYGRPISLRTLSPTLVMAQIGSIKRIYFFRTALSPIILFDISLHFPQMWVWKYLFLMIVLSKNDILI